MIVSTASLVVLALFAGTPAGVPGGDPPPAAATTTTAASGDGGARIIIVVTDGGTQVHNKGTSFVSVTPNEGKPQVVEPGAKADFATPDGAQVKLKPPSLLSPSDRERVTVKPTEKGLGPIVLSWAPVAGVREYEVEFQVDNGKPTLLKVQRTEYRLPPLPPGKVLWAVRSVADGTTSESSRRWFELHPDHTLKAGATGWK